MMYKLSMTRPNIANNIFTCLLVLGVLMSATFCMLVTGFLSVNEMMIAETNSTAKM